MQLLRCKCKMEFSRVEALDAHLEYYRKRAIANGKTSGHRKARSKAESQVDNEAKKRARRAFLEGM